MKLLLNKKAQLSIEDAPSVVLIVGLIFLVMATVGVIGEKYGEAIPSDTQETISNESITLTNLQLRTYTVASTTSCNPESYTLVSVLNGTATDGFGSIPIANYTLTSTGVIYNATSNLNMSGGLNVTPILVTYTYKHAGVACNVTADLNKEIANNTSIAGIVLTISLIGIVLTILIGIFVGFRARRV